MSFGNPLEMSDEDFLKNLGSMQNASAPSSEETQTEAQTPKPEGEGAEEQTQEQQQEQQEETLTDAERAAQAEGEEETSAPEGENKDKPAEGADPAADADKDKPKEGVDPKPEEGKEKELVAEPVNYENLYQELMKPFKANGRMVEARTPEEARQLMQMGANYTKKMQALQQHNKVLLMLQNNDLLDTGKLDFLVALEKKDPEAIKKLIKDSGINPLDIDTDTEHAFQPGTHTVTDQQAAFATALDELDSTPEGKQTLDEIDKTWDEPSKRSLMENPQALAEIHKHREAGIYDLITAEMDHQRTLGKLPAGQSFVQNYKMVGDAMAAAGGFDHLDKPETVAKDPVVPAKEEPKVIAQRPAAPSKTVKNDDAASAASSSRASPREAKPFVNVLAMSDDDFLKQFQGRV